MATEFNSDFQNEFDNHARNCTTFIVLEEVRWNNIANPQTSQYIFWSALAFLVLPLTLNSKNLFADEPIHLKISYAAKDSFFYCKVFSSNFPKPNSSIERLCGCCATTFCCCRNSSTVISGSISLWI